MSSFGFALVLQVFTMTSHALCPGTSYLLRWSRVCNSAMRFNKLLLFRSKQIHDFLPVSLPETLHLICYFISEFKPDFAAQILSLFIDN